MSFAQKFVRRTLWLLSVLAVGCGYYANGGQARDPDASGVGEERDPRPFGGERDSVDRLYP
jgi:hypothetical protein